MTNRNATKLIKKMTALTLIFTYFFVFHTKEVSFADEAAHAQAAFSKDQGFAGFDAVTASQADPFTGAASLSVPIFAPPGRKGLAPQVSLSYSSRGGNSWVGYGWSYDPGQIDRSTKDGVPNYDNTDTFLLNFGGSVELVSIGNNEYRAKNEALFMRVFYNTATDDWTVTDKSGTKYFFGRNQAVGETNPISKVEKGNDTYSWHLDRVEDLNGNYMEYIYDDQYLATDNTLYLKEIRYNAHTSGTPNFTHRIRFELQATERADVRFHYTTGQKVTSSYLLNKIYVEVNDGNSNWQLSRRYELTYGTSASSNRSLLNQVTEFGDDGTSSLPPIEFTYNQMELNFDDTKAAANNWQAYKYGGMDLSPPETSYSGGAALRDSDVAGNHVTTRNDLLDINGDGIPDKVYKNNEATTDLTVQLGKQDGTGFLAITTWTGFYRPSVEDTETQWNYLDWYDHDKRRMMTRWVDINQDGYLDRFFNVNKDLTWDFQTNNGTSFDSHNVSTDEWSITEYEDPNKNWTGDVYLYFQKENKLNANNDIWYGISDLVDINGDGLLDRVLQNAYLGGTDQYDPSGAGDNQWEVHLNNGNGFDAVTTWTIPSMTGGDAEMKTYLTNSKIDGSYRIHQLMLTDMNGDGLPDRVYNYSDTNTFWYVQLNNGAGFEPEMQWSNVDKWGVDQFNYLRASEGDFGKCELMDINQDGLPDRVMVKDGNTQQLEVQLNNGHDGFENRQTVTGALNFGNSSNGYLSYTRSSDSQTRMSFRDLDGDGRLDRVIQQNDGNPYYHYQTQKGDYPDLLKTVMNGRGGSTTFQYKASTRYDNTGENDTVPDLPFPMQVVSKITLDSGEGHTYTTDYFYQNGKFDSQEKEFRGFGCVSMIDAEFTETRHYYHQDAVNAGKLTKKEVYANADSPNPDLYARTITTWQTDTDHNGLTGVDFTYVKYEDEYIYDGDSTYKRRRTEFSYDVYGNLTETLEHGEFYDANDPGKTNVTGDERKTVNTYDTSNTTDWLLNLLTRTELLDDLNTLVSQKDFLYDANGNLLQEEEWLDGGDNPITSMTYDVYGNILTIKDANQQGTSDQTSNTYETTYYQFLTQVTNALGHTQQFTYDARQAKILTTTDANGQVTQTTYDPFGRPKKVIEPGDDIANPTRQFSYTPYSNAGGNFVCEKVQVDVKSGVGDGYLTTYTFVDGMSRKTQTRVEAEDDPTTGNPRQIVMDRVEYDSRGQVIKQFVPYFEDYFTTCQPLPTQYEDDYTAFQYDSVGRKTKTILPDGSFTQTTYSDWYQQVITNNADLSNQQKMSRDVDAYGRVVKIIEYLEGSPQYTFYEYDVRDQLTRTTDAVGNVTNITYDSLGRKILLEDDDTGLTSYVYDKNGNLTQQTDALGSVITFSYDELNRVINKNYSDPNTEDVTYDYEEPVNPAPNSIGRLRVVSTPTSSISFVYDVRGRVETETQTFDGVTYDYEYNYDSMNRKTSIIYPSNHEVHYFYNDGGAIESVGSSALNTNTYVQNIDYNAAGQRERIHYGNDVETLYEYDPELFRLDKITTYDTNDQIIQHFSYNFDNNGNVLSIIDHENTGTQFFEYDSLNRLTKSLGFYGVTDYTYDAIGNILAKGDTTYSYAQNGAGPHQVTNTVSDLTNVSLDYTYDANGNMLTRGQDTFAYDAENRLKTITRSVAASGTQSMSFHQGWNLVSFPYLDEDATVAEVLDGLDYDQVSYYDAEVGKWRHYVGDAAFNEFLFLEQGRGYMVHVNTAGTITTPEGRLLLDDKVLNLKNGWNYIGNITGTTDTASNVFSGLSYTELKRLNAQTQQWEVVDPNDNIEPDKGYAINMSLVTSHTLLAAQGSKEVSGAMTYGPNGDRIRKVIEKDNIVTKDHKFIGSGFESYNGDVMISVFVDDFRIAELRTDLATPALEDGIKFLHTDHLNSTNITTGWDGVKEKQFEYTAFGDDSVELTESAIEGTSEDYEVWHKYTGQKEDADLDLYYYNARYYDPELGRFLTADSFVQSPYDPQSLNRYAYARNNPIKFIDPSGHIFGLIAAIIVGVVVGAISAGIQTNWDFRAMMIGALVGGIAGGAGFAVSGAVSGSLGGVIGKGAAGFVGAILGGAVAGAVGGGLNAAFHGGSIKKRILMGSAYGALGGAVFAGINGLPIPFDGGGLAAVRAGLMISAGGSISKLSGGSFWEGVAISSAIVGSQFAYQLSTELLYDGDSFGPSLEGSDGTFAPKGQDQAIHALKSGHSNIGSKDLNGFLSKIGLGEDSSTLRWISKNVGGIESTSKLHDLWLENGIKNVIGGAAGKIGAQIANVPTMIPTGTITYLGVANNDPSMMAYAVLNQER